MKRIGVSIIGVGSISESSHIPSLMKIPCAKLTSICDIRPERLKLLGTKYNIKKMFLNYKDAIDDSDTNAVIIATNAYSHAEIALYAIKKKKPVFLEKPITLLIPHAEMIVEESKKNKVPIMIGYQLRFLPNHTLTKSYMKKYIGQVYSIYIRAETLVIKPAESLLIDYGTHFFDLIRYYLNDQKIVSISGQVIYDKNKIQIAATALLEFESGIHATIELFWLPDFNWGVVDRSLTIVGSKGKISTKMSGPDITLWRSESFRDKMLGPKNILPKETVNPYLPLSDLCYLKELETFFYCLRNKTKMPSNAEDGLKALQIADYILKSFTKGKKFSGLKI